MAKAPDGRIWFLEAAANKIGAIDPSTNLSQDYVIPTPNSGATDITLGPDGNLWFTETAVNQIGEVNARTGAITEIAIPPSTTSGPVNNGPLDIVAADGQLWFTEVGTNRIAAYNPSTATFQQFLIPTQNSEPTGIALGPDGNLWFTEYGAGKLGRLNPFSGAVSDFALPLPTPATSPGSIGPNGIVAGPDGRMWVTETLANQIVSFDPYKNFASQLSIAMPNSGPLNIAVGPDNGLWFTQDNGDSLGEINPVTDAQSEYALPQAGSVPLDLLEAADGNMWFTEKGTSELGILVSTTAIDPAGSCPCTLSSVVGQPFSTLLQTEVTDSSGKPVVGATATFSEANGATGAGATFAGGATTATATTNAQGLAIAPVLTAGDMAGSFTVTASVGDLSTVFNLTNQPGPAAHVTVFGGDDQDAVVGTAFGSPLQALVTDSHGNPVPGVPLAFNGTGGIAVMKDAHSATVLTDARGIATSGMFWGNQTPGECVVTASVQNVASSAIFRLNVTPPITPPQATLTDPNGVADDYYGYSVAASGNEVLVGEPGANNRAGAAFLYDTTGKLLHMFPAPGSQVPQDFGGSVALADGYVVIGAPALDDANGAVGAVYIYSASSNWTQPVQITNPNLSNIGFADSVAISGSNVLVGGNVGLNQQGAAYLFGLGGQLLQTFQEPNPGQNDFFGESVALDGNDVLVGAEGVKGGAGAAYLFSTSGSLLMTIPDPHGTPMDAFGVSVALSANSLLVGAFGTGKAYLLDMSGNVVQTFSDPNINGIDFGSSVAQAGNEVLVAAPVDYNFQGGAYLFDASSGKVIQSFIDPNATVADFFGQSVAMSATNSATNIIVGAPDVNHNQGAAYLYTDPAILNLVQGVQSATVGTGFLTPLGVSVKDAAGNPLVKVPVTFTVHSAATRAGPAGAGATFADGSATATVLSNDQGEAYAPALTANDVAGSYTVAASMGNVRTTFPWLNMPAAPAKINVFAGNRQDAQFGTAFGSPLQALVTDSYGNPVAGVPVTFSLSTNALLADFHTLPATVLTDARGVATAPALTSKNTPGSLGVTASVQGVASPASFQLYVLPPSTPPQVTIPDPSPAQGIDNAQFGYAVAASGNDVLVGAPGLDRAYLFDSSGNMLHEFDDPNSQTSDFFGNSVALSGTDVLIADSGAGVVYRYAASGPYQSLQTYTPPSGYGGFAQVAVSGNYVVLGGSFISQGLMVVGGTVFVVDTATGTSLPIQAPDMNPLFGSAVAVSGNKILIADPGFNGIGAAYVYTTSGQLVTSFTDPLAVNDGTFGDSVAISGNEALVGAPTYLNDHQVYLFNLANNSRTTFTDPYNDSRLFGQSVAFAGGEVLVGAPEDNDQGAAYLFDKSGNLLQTFLDPNATVNDSFGYAVAASINQLQTHIVVGAPGVFCSSGAAYLYHDPVLLNAVVGPLSAIVGTSLGGPLHVAVEDASGKGLVDVPVTFTVNSASTSAVPGARAGATFPDGSTTATAWSNDNGEVFAPLLMANDIAGSYTVTATLGNTSTTFAVSNTPGAPANISVVGGGMQNTPIGSAYASRFEVMVTDSFGNPVAGVPVSFTAPQFGPTGEFDAGATATGGASGGLTPQIIAILIGAKIPTNVLGIATAPMFTANHAPGHFMVTATVPGVSTQADFSLTNTTVPAAIKVLAGSGQKTTVNTSFRQTLAARVTDAAGNPVQGITVDFEVPGMGAGGTFGAPGQVVTDANGVARAPALTANTVAGTFTVNAWVAGVASPAMFILSNAPAAPAAIVAVQGTPQTGAVGKPYAQHLKALVTDAFNNPISGVKVTFKAPISGASGTFANQLAVPVVTGPAGVAIAPTFTANLQPGSFTVTATVTGVAPSASFSLTNIAGLAAQLRVVTVHVHPPSDGLIAPDHIIMLPAVEVLDAAGHPLSGVPVTFMVAPNTAGAQSASDSGRATVTVVTDSHGIVLVPASDLNMGHITLIASVARGKQKPLSVAFDPPSI
jgi:adhesin/invasin